MLNDMLDILITGSDMCGNVYPREQYRGSAAQGVDRHINEYIGRYRTVCHVNIHVALPMNDTNTIRRVT